MDRYAVLVFRDQPLTDEQQLEFSRNFGELEVTLAGQMAKPEDRRLGDRLELGDISNLTARNELARARRPQPDVRAGQPAVALRRIVPCRRRRLHAAARTRSFRATAATPNSPTCAPPTMRSMTRPRPRSRTCHRALDRLFARADRLLRLCRGNEDRLRPVRHRLVITHPVSGRKSLYLSSHIGGIVGWPRAGGARLHPRPDGACDAARSSSMRTSGG